MVPHEAHGLRHWGPRMVPSLHPGFNSPACTHVLYSVNHTNGDRSAWTHSSKGVVSRVASHMVSLYKWDSVAIRET